MQAALGLLNTLLPIVYLLLWTAYFMIFLKENRFAARWSQPLLFTTLLLHTLYLVLRMIALDRLPMGSPLEFFSLLALAILCIYAVIERRIKVSQTGFLVIAFAFLLQFLSSSFARSGAPDNALLHEIPFAVHAVLVLFAYTCLSIAFLYALLYLLQARNLNRREFGLFYRRMPALDVLERMSVGAVKLGVPALFAGLITGHLWLESLLDREDVTLNAGLSHLDPKVIATWITFLIYSIGAGGHKFLGWRGRRMNLLAIAAFIMVIIAMAVIHHFLPSFHNFSIRGEA